MSAIAYLDAPSRSIDPLTGWLEDVLVGLGAAVADCTDTADADRIDRIAVLERLRAVTAAVQAAECVRFARSQTAQQMAQEVHPKAIGRGIADQIALACHLSPSAGSRRLTMARAWWYDLPETFAELTAGRLSEHVAGQVVIETRHLDAQIRRRVDAEVVAAGITMMGVKAAAACARKHAYQADPAGYVQRGRTERKHRRVGLRPAPDTMAIVTGYLPVESGVACLASLKKHTDSLVATGDGRSRDQIMADTLVERLTGQTSAADVPVEVQIMMPLDLLVDPASDRTATLVGGGPLPGGLAREIITTSQSRHWWRRLFTHPATAGGEIVVGGDPHRRRFDGWPAHLIGLRDQSCTTRTVMRRSAISTTSSVTPTTAPPLWPMAAGSAPAATTPAKCPAGTLTYSTTETTPPRTLSGSPPPPATPTPAAHPTPLDAGSVQGAGAFKGGLNWAAARSGNRRRVRTRGVDE